MIEDYKTYVNTDVFRTQAIIVRNSEFTVDTPLYNTGVNGIPLIRNDEPLYVGGIKFYPFPFNFSPPEQNENSINDAKLSVTVLNQLAYIALKDITTPLEIEVRSYKVMEKANLETISVYDQGKTISVVSRHDLTLLNRAFYVVNAYTLNHQSMEFTLTYSAIGSLGVGVLSYTVDVTPNIFERLL